MIRDKDIRETYQYPVLPSSVPQERVASRSEFLRAWEYPNKWRMRSGWTLIHCLQICKVRKILSKRTVTSDWLSITFCV